MDDAVIADGQGKGGSQYSPRELMTIVSPPSRTPTQLSQTESPLRSEKSG